MARVLGFVTATFPNERRVALLPQHARPGWVVERGYGRTLGIPDSRYQAAGCVVVSRESVYATCDTIVNLKLTQPADYPLLRARQTLAGWTHPTGSGRDFCAGIATDLDLTIADLDNAAPLLWRRGRTAALPIPVDFVWLNSWLAGHASVTHALTLTGRVPNASTPACVLGSGNVSQGAATALIQAGFTPRVFTRRNLPRFNPGEYRIIVNGIDAGHPLVTLSMQRACRGTLYIDAAADAGGTIEGIPYTSFTNPTIEVDGNTFYCVNNSPSYYFRDASEVISAAWATHAYDLDYQELGEALA